MRLQEFSNYTLLLNCIFLKRFYLLIFREGKGGRKRETNINVWWYLTHPLLGTWPTTQGRALTGNQTGVLLICKLPLNPLSHTSQCLIAFFTGIFSLFCMNCMSNIKFINSSCAEMSRAVLTAYLQKRPAYKVGPWLEYGNLDFGRVSIPCPLR